MSTGPEPGTPQRFDKAPVVVVGKTGDTGHDGQPGKPGKTGRDGSNAVFSTTQVLVVFLFVVAVFLLLAYRSEINARSIRDANHSNAVQVYAQCEASRGNAVSLSAVLDQILVSVKRRTDTTPAIKKESIRIYTNAKPKVVDCGTKP